MSKMLTDKNKKNNGVSLFDCKNDVGTSKKGAWH
jgi:hypothetical protein